MLRALVVVGCLCSCMAEEPARRPAPPPPRLLSEAQAEKIRPLLAGCDSGDLDACSDLGLALRKAKQFEAAIAANDQACHFNGPARSERYCDRYLAGDMCDPSLCARCVNGGPGCGGYSSYACAKRHYHCPHDVGGNLPQALEICLEMMKIEACYRAARDHVFARNELTERGNTYCTDEEIALLRRAYAFVTEGFSRFKASPAAGRIPSDTGPGAGTIEDFGDAVRRWNEEVVDCQQLAANRINREHEYSQMFLEAMGLLAQSSRQLAQTAQGVAAANAGYVPSFTPGAPVEPGAPMTFVNPKTGAQWGSPNIARIASLDPANQKLAAGTACAPCAECDGLKSECGTTMAACYQAAKCLCACHLRQGGCGSTRDALQRCIDDNDTKAGRLRGGTAVSGRPATPPKPAAAPASRGSEQGTPPRGGASVAK